RAGCRRRGVLRWLGRCSCLRQGRQRRCRRPRLGKLSSSLLLASEVLERERSPASEAVVGRVLCDGSALAGGRESGGVEPRALPGKTGASGELVAGDGDVDEGELRLGDVEDEAVEDAASVQPPVRAGGRAAVAADADVSQLE